MKTNVIFLVGTYDREISDYKERLIVELEEEDIEIIGVGQNKLGITPNLVSVEFKTTKKKSDTANNKKQAELNIKIREATDKLYTEDYK